MTIAVQQHVQRLDWGRKVTLFEIDATRYNQGIFRLVGGTRGDVGQETSFGGEDYQPWAFKASGFNVRVNGTMPRPTLTLANTQGVLTGIVNASNDLKGCPVRRLRTYGRFLDDGAEPDAENTLPDDIFVINQKQRHSTGAKGVVQFQLISPLDQEGAAIPGREMLKDACPWTTRTWDPVAGAFDYEGALCPFNESEGLDGLPRDVDGNLTTPENEVFSKRLTTCCKARYGNLPLPFGGFPSVGKFKG